MMLSRLSKKLILLMTFLAVGGFIFACPAFTTETYKIGGIFSVTGPASFLGDPEKKSMEMMIDQINDAGGIDGHLLEGVIYDTEGDPQRSVNNVTKLINKDNVIAIVGPSRTPTTLAVIPFAERVQIPLISCAAGITIVDPVKKWVFKTAQNDALAVCSVYQHMKDNGIKKIGIITVTNAFGESGKNQLKQHAGDFGIEIVEEESFGAKDTDMTPQLTKIRKVQPDAIVCWGTNPGPAVVAKNIKQLEINMPLYQSHGVASPKFIELAGEAAEGIYLPTGKILVADLLPDTDPQKKILMEYQKNFEETYGQSVSGFGGYAYDAMMMLERALPGTNGDLKKLRDNIENIKGLVGISGTFNFTPEDHNGLAPDAFVMVKIENGTWKLVE